MTFKIVLLRTGQLIFSLVFIALLVSFIGFFAKALYKLFMLGFNAL